MLHKKTFTKTHLKNFVQEMKNLSSSPIPPKKSEVSQPLCVCLLLSNLLVQGALRGVGLLLGRFPGVPAGPPGGGHADPACGDG